LYVPSVAMSSRASFGFGVQAALLLLLYVGDTRALFNGNPVGSSADVPGVTGSLFLMNTEDEATNAATCTSGDEGIVPFCTVALISPGVVLTAAHCLQNQITAGDPSAFANLRVALGRKITYQNDDGSCAGRVLGPSDGIYKVKAAFWPNGFQAFSTMRNELSVAMDYMDYLVLYLDTCATSGGASAKVAGAAFADYVKARGGGPGLNTTFWGYGENEMGASNFDGVARTATYTWTRTSSSAGVSGQKNMWIDCHWLPDSASTFQYSQGLAGYKSTSNMVAAPNIMCAASNPTTIRLCSQINDQAACLNAKKTTKAPIQSFCEWSGGQCHVNVSVAGGNGVVTLPAPGGGDSGGPYWVRKSPTAFTHAGLLMGGSELYPRWAIASQTAYMQNWLLAALDRDTCIAGSSLDYFDGYNAAATNLHPGATTAFQGGLAHSATPGFGDLSLLPRRASGGGDKNVLMA